jgi:alkylation response protein AidB-like acyl-CoA dehydrogenase
VLFHPAPHPTNQTIRQVRGVRGNGTAGGAQVVLDHVSAAILPLTAPAVKFDRRPRVSFGADEVKMGWNAQPTRQVVLDGVRLPADRLLGVEGDGFRIAMSGLNGGRLGIAACSLGGAGAALDAATAFLGDRRAFGGPLINAQALRFRLAEMATDLEAARSLVWRAAAALDEGDAEAAPLCAMANRLAPEARFTVADQALQLHGGYGYLTEYGIEKIVRDLRVHRILEGTNEIMSLIIARGLTGAA